MHLPLLCGIYLLILMILAGGILLLRKFQVIFKVGSQIYVCIKPPNSNAMKFKPKLLKYEPEKEIRWIGKFYLPKLVDGEHSLSIKKLDNENVLFVQKETFSGLLVPFISGLLKDTKTGFELMNNELKKEAEQKEMN